MNKLLIIMFVFTLVIFISPKQISAQVDTVDVAISPPGNINTVINGDTLAGGFRAHPDRIYRLKRGSIYQVTEAMNINGNIKIVATAGTNRPPVLAPAILSDNSSIDHFFTFIGKGSKVSVSDVYLISFRADGVQLGWSDGMRVSADSIKLDVKGCVFDGFTDAGIVINNQWAKMTVQDCVFRNHQHSTSWFGGQPLMTGSPIHQDTCKVINNTFFCNNSYSWSIRGYCPYALLEHNTFVYGIVNPFLIRQAPNLHIKNNLFYAMHAMGGNPDHVINSWFLNYPDTASDGIIHVRAYDTTSYWYKLWGSVAINGPNSYVDAANGVTAEMVSNKNMVLDIENNLYYWPQKYFDFIKNYNDTTKTYDSVQVPIYGTGNEVNFYLKRILYLPSWISAYTLWSIDNIMKPAGASVNVSNNMSMDPGFDSPVQSQLDNALAYVVKISTNKLDVPWFYNPNNAVYPPVWPLPENLTYTNNALINAGTDGYALGDLNWFPAQKSQWITGVETISSNIPEEYKLSQNYPNPFNPQTKIEFALTKNENVKLIVYNVLGQKVKTLLNQNLNAGSYNATWDGTNEFGKQVTSGIYFYSLETETFKATKKMILMK